MIAATWRVCVTVAGACDRHRYWDETTGARQRRKVRARLERKRPPQPRQRTLEELTRCVEQFGQ